MNAPVSPAGSAQGWSFRVWLAKNKGGLKWIVTLLVAFLSTLIPGIPSPELQALVAAVLSTGTKLFLDWLDFYLSDVPMEPKG